MITIQTTPPETFFAGNPVLFGINSTSLHSHYGRHCQFYLVISAADTTPDHTLTFAFPDKTVIFTTKSLPDDSGLQIRTAFNSADWATWAQTVFNCLLSNMDISSRFQITIEEAGSSNRVLFLKAHKEGIASSVVVTSHLTTATVYTYISGIDSIFRNNFSIVAGIWNESMIQIAQDIKPVNASGDVTFNFSEYLSTFLINVSTPRFTWPFNPLKLYCIFTNYVLPFYAGFAERWDGVTRMIYFDTIRNAFPGGLNRETMVAYNAASLNFFNVAENLLSFMTWAPLVKQTSKTTPELLFFYVISKAPFDNIDLAVAVSFTDGTSDTFLTNISLAGDMSFAISNVVIELSVGFEHLDLAGRYPAKTVSQWAVKLSNQDLHLDTEIRTFILDNKFH
jgi:hypothetical protein